MFDNNITTKSECKNAELSLLELLNKEDRYVDRLNESYRALDIAKKKGLRYIEYERDAKNAEVKLQECREEIKKYLGKYLGINTN